MEAIILACLSPGKEPITAGTWHSTSATAEAPKGGQKQGHAPWRASTCSNMDSWAHLFDHPCMIWAHLHFRGALNIKDKAPQITSELCRALYEVLTSISDWSRCEQLLSPSSRPVAEVQPLLHVSVIAVTGKQHQVQGQLRQLHCTVGQSRTSWQYYSWHQRITCPKGSKGCFPAAACPAANASAFAFFNASYCKTRCRRYWVFDRFRWGKIRSEVVLVKHKRPALPLSIVKAQQFGKFLIYLL